MDQPPEAPKFQLAGLRGLVAQCTDDLLLEAAEAAQPQQFEQIDVSANNFIWSGGPILQCSDRVISGGSYALCTDDLRDWFGIVLRDIKDDGLTVMGQVEVF